MYRLTQGEPVCRDECTGSRKASQCMSRRIYRLTQGEPVTNLPAHARRASVCQDEFTGSRKASLCVPSPPSRECKLTQGKPAQSTCPESTIVLVLVFCGSRLDSSSPMKHVASRFSIARRTLEESGRLAHSAIAYIKHDPSPMHLCTLRDEKIQVSNGW